MALTTPTRSWRRRLTSGAVALTLSAASVVVPATSGTSAAMAAVGSDAVRTDTPWPPFGGFSPNRGWGYGVPSFGTTTAVSGLDTSEATAAEAAGMVLISAAVDFGQGGAAGTGMVIEDGGIVVTNHHVVEGATSIEVTVASSGETYEATVLGTDSVRDIAVLQLEDAPLLETVSTDTAALSVGDTVTAVGDAGGDGGGLTAASGTVTALRENITVEDAEDGSSRLRNLIEVDADVVSGDSGGALLDDDGEVVGMNVAASSGSPDITGYAIPIARVLRVAEQILAGEDAGSVVIGQAGMLGIGLAVGSDEAIVAGVVSGSPAAELGLRVGDTITSFDGADTSSASQLSAVIGSYQAGDMVTVTWTDASGTSHSGNVTLATGPVA